jgi:DNA-binding response OmpR family regulator
MTVYGSNVLILDDDPAIREEVCEALELEGFTALSAANGDEMRRLASHHEIALFVLDLTLPGENGLEIAKALREQSDVGIIIVTGRIAEADRIVGLELGADDYVTKPFSARELLARVKSVLRRIGSANHSDTSNHSAAESVLEFAQWRFNLNSRELSPPSGPDVPLTTAEFELLQALVEAPQRVLTRDFLLDRLHGPDWVGYDRGVDGLVSRLRRKFRAADSEFGNTFIKSIRGVGYMFTRSVTRSPSR